MPCCRVRDVTGGWVLGIDVDEWNPSNDIFLPASFSAASPEGKAICKEYLQKVRGHLSTFSGRGGRGGQGLGLEVTSKKPLVSCISRLVPQKGINLIRRGVYHTHESGSQFVLLGAGHADGDFRSMAENAFKDDPNVRLLMLYSDALAHLIYAASDIVLVPSLFEPCGLTQMIAMRYGALPVVRLTGGLADTVHDIDLDGDGGLSHSLTLLENM